MFALALGASLPVMTAQGATPVRTVEHSVTGQWDAGFQGAVKVTDHTAALSGRSLTFDFTDGQKITQGWTARWSPSGTTVTATNESRNGTPGTGVSVSAGFTATKPGADAVPTTFDPDGTTCDVDADRWHVPRRTA
ncbi:cellulose binding domain-containing protein [Streptomyces bobili]|uniref:cellulose binding domain-containing protein n=1 Tax=Streptomyces bobili TaxID=67280 RepID=UPI0036F9F150